MPNPYEIETPNGTVDLRERVLTPRDVTRLRCDNCNKEVARVVAVGQFPEDWESPTARLCRPCLVAALAAMDARGGVERE